MPVKVIKDTSDQFVKNWIDNRFKAIIYQLSYIGEKAVNEARARGSYKDQSGNLRSSIGYVISLDGKIVKWGEFKAAGNGSTSGEEGVRKGKEFAEDVGTDVKSGFCLTVVAGMEYAQYVIAREYNVLQTSELLARREAEKLVSKLKGR